MAFEDPVFGFDISAHQPYINWGQVAKACEPGAHQRKEFVVIKITDYFSDSRAKYVSSQWEKQRAGATSVGLKKTYYMYFRAWKLGLEQAEHFLRYIPDDWDFVPVFDFEDKKGTLEVGPSRTSARAIDCLEKLEAEFGRKPIVYTAKWYTSMFDQRDIAVLSRYPSWIANWPYGGFSSTFKISMPSYLSEPVPDIWQYTASGRIPGITTAGLVPTSVDLDVAERSKFEKLLVNHQEEPPDLKAVMLEVQGGVNYVVERM